MQSTYNGDVKTKEDAIILFEASRLGILPKVKRRLSGRETKSIKSGSVFIWTEKETDMRRWTDGMLWSASRVLGGFLTYTEMEGTKGTLGHNNKWGGSIRKSLSATTNAGERLHIIIYSSRDKNKLPRPTDDQTLKHIIPDMTRYPELEAEGLHATIPCNNDDDSRESSTNKGGLSALSFPRPVSAHNQPCKQYSLHQSNGMPQHPQQMAFDQQPPPVSLPPPTQHRPVSTAAQTNYALAEAAFHAASQTTIAEDKRTIKVLDRKFCI